MAVTRRRKLLTAAVGVATVSYVVACGGLGKGGETSGNLVAAGGTYGHGGAETSGNLVAAGGTQTVFPQGGSGGYGGGETSGNLVAAMGGSGGAPVPIDAGARDASPADNEGDAAAAPGDAAVDSGP